MWRYGRTSCNWHYFRKWIDFWMRQSANRATFSRHVHNETIIKGRKTSIWKIDVFFEFEWGVEEYNRANILKRVFEFGFASWCVTWTPIIGDWQIYRSQRLQHLSMPNKSSIISPFRPNIHMVLTDWIILNWIGPQSDVSLKGLDL